ncbi:hypothetical protein BJY24_001184 [Nocardia transvalensis]|uniref:DUF3291 domain-containing protein n=1 Tax=Nocardia transvalensis TaxID=37333 RepID=A0A7W9UGM8_9NOCA|nr:hypothetical protein [Nocardia transvalensis]MBB5912317.1 hypothetical protein [Nocardia transvalensis]
MPVRQTPWAALRDLTVTTPWMDGTAASSAGPYMFSLTQFTPTRLTDLPQIWRASRALSDQLVRIDEAIGVTTYIRPAHHAQVGSLSIWTDPRGLNTFMTLPDHITIMNKYRTRGLPVRSATWWSHSLDPEAAVREGLHLLDTHDTQRVSTPKPAEADHAQSQD